MENNVETFNGYQSWAQTTAIYPGEIKVLYPLMGVAGETAELVEKILPHLHATIQATADKADVDRIMRADDLLQQLVDIGKELETLKKHFRKNGMGAGISLQFAVTPEQTGEISKEMGDAFWYDGALASDLNLLLGDVARQNHDKLESRKARNVLDGQGDNR